MNIVITGGGTGGHLSIVKALKEELNARGVKPIFIGSSNGQDKQWFENDNGFEQKYFLKTKGVTNKKYIGKLLSLLNILILSIKCISLFHKHKVTKIVCVGGYSAAPASIAAKLSFKDLYIHEQNSKIGSLNRLLKPLAKEFFSSYVVPATPYPVSQKYFDIYRARDSVKTVIFLGGSQGAKSINDFAMSVASYLRDSNIDIIHQAGAKDFQRVKKYYDTNNIKVDVFDFSDDLVSKLSHADFAVARAGAGTLWELVACGLPTLFVPYPYAASNHQYYNAKFLFDQNLAFVMNDAKMSQNEFKKYLKIDLRGTNQKLKDILPPNGTKIIVDKIMESK